MTNQAQVLPVPQQEHRMNIQTAGVKAEEVVLIEGELFFSALTQKSDEFTKHSNFKKSEFGVRIANPRILHASGTDNGQNLARYLASQVYGSTYEEQTTPALTVTTTGAKPRLFDKVVRSENGFEAERELGRQTVVVQVGSFKSGQYANVGVGLNSVLVEDQNNMVYFKGGGANIAGFSALGLQANPDAPAFTPATKAEPQAQQQQTFTQPTQPNGSNQQQQAFTQPNGNQQQTFTQPNGNQQQPQQNFQQPQADPFAQPNGGNQQMQQPQQNFQQPQADPFTQPNGGNQQMYQQQQQANDPFATNVDPFAQPNA